MADYTELKGLKVKYLDSDPSPGTAGDVWYNTTTGQLKSFLATTAFSASSPVLTARSYGGSAGTQTANVFFGGEIYPNPNASTEEYDGTGWTASNNMNVGRGSIGGFGIQTAAVAVAGTHPAPSDIVANVEEYNGSSWTAGNNYPASVTNSNGSGTLTSGIQMGGHTATANQDASNEYDGTNWTSGGDMNSARNAFMAATQGTQTATLAAGGGTANCETYDGSSWTEVGNLPVSCGNNKGGGTQTNAVSYGGEPPGGVPAGVEAYTWDGTSWTASANMAKHRIQLAGSGTATAALAISGVQPGLISDTEEWHNTFTVVTAGAWASSGAMPVAVYGGASFGIQTSAVHSAGVPPANAADNDTYEYNGSTWSSGGALPANRQSIAGAGASETSGLAFCGAIPSNSQPSHTFHNNTYEYDGSSWTNGGNYPTGLSATGGSGTQTAAIGAGGTSTAPGAPGITNASATYDGSSWTAAPNTGTSATRHNMITGTTTSAVSIANYPPFGCEEFDGSSWTAGGTPNVADYSKAHTGTSSSDALVAGRDSAPREQCESYNGTTWATSPNVTTGRASMGTGRGVNPTATKVIFGGYSPPGNHNQTEEFTPESSADTAKTIDFD